MKAWLKRFFKGTYIAYWMILVVGVVFIVLRLGIMAIIIAYALLTNLTMTTNGIIIFICGCFVILFGLMYSVWD